MSIITTQKVTYELIATADDVPEPFAYFNQIDTSLPPIITPGLRWHWRATLPAIPSDATEIALVNSIYARAELAISGVWSGHFAIDGGASHLLANGPSLVFSGHCPQYWVNIDPREAAIYDAANPPPTLEQLMTQPESVFGPFDVVDHDVNFGRGPIVNPSDVEATSPFEQSAYEDIFLRGFLRYGGETDGPLLPPFRPDSSWTSALTALGAIYRAPPFPHTVDFTFEARSVYEALDIPGPPTTGGTDAYRNVPPVAWTFPDLSLYVVIVRPDPPPPVVPTTIAVGPRTGGPARGKRRIGRRGVGPGVFTSSGTGWVTVGATYYNDAPPGAGSLAQPGYHFAELGTARRTDGGATGVGWVARALGMTGELPMGFQLEIEYNGRTIIADKQDRGYGQSGDGITSDPAYAVDLWDGSGSGWDSASGALGFPGGGTIRIRPH